MINFAWPLHKDTYQLPKKDSTISRCLLHDDKGRNQVEQSLISGRIIRKTSLDELPLLSYGPQTRLKDEASAAFRLYAVASVPDAE